MPFFLLNGGTYQPWNAVEDFLLHSELLLKDHFVKSREKKKQLFQKHKHLEGSNGIFNGKFRCNKKSSQL